MKYIMVVFGVAFSGCMPRYNSDVVESPSYSHSSANIYAENLRKEENKKKITAKVCKSIDEPFPSKNNLVFGLPLGKVLSLPECPKDQYGTTYEQSPEILCFKRDWAHEDDPYIEVCDEEVYINFPIGQYPSIVSALVPLKAQIISGRLESIKFHTYGYNVQDDVLKKLVSKFGKPDSFDVAKKLNAYGTAYDSYNASWKIDDTSPIYITF